jgi:hypothetical protein
MSFYDDDNDYYYYDNNNNNNNTKIPGKPEEHLGKARNQGTTENSRTGYCTYTSDRTTVKVPIFRPDIHTVYI